MVAPRYVGGDDLPREPAGSGVVQDTTTVPDASRITPPRLAKGFDPKVSLGIEVELFGSLAELACSQHAVHTSAGPESARVALSKEREPLDRDFVLRWKLAGERVQSQLLVHGEFALLSLVPPAREGFLGAPRDVVFVLDRSGSMQGPKMASAARACALLLRTLGPRDRFSLQAFDDRVEWMPGGFAAADEAGLERGEKWLRRIEARGGTELDAAMGEALRQVRERTEGAGRASVVVLLTDGQVGDESSVLKRLQGEAGEARLFTVGVDTAVNDGFLRRLAALGGGTTAFVEPGARLEEALQSVGREIGTPLVTGLRIEGGAQDLAPARIADLFAGRASAVFFRLDGRRVKVEGRFADGGAFKQEVEAREAPLAALDHLWARARITDLEDEFRASHSAAVKEQIVALSVRHGVLTRFTAFVVVDEQEVANKQGTRRTVVQPVEMPAEWEGGLPAATIRGIGALHPLAGAPPGYGPRASAKGGARAMAQSTGARAQAGLHHLMQQLTRRPAAEERATPEDRDRVRLALEAFLRTFAEARAGKAGAPDLDRARLALLQALSGSLALATALPRLQAFLRAAAVELVAALSAGAATAAVFAEKASLLEAARAEARPILDGNSPASFWEASI